LTSRAIAPDFELTSWPKAACPTTPPAWFPPVLTYRRTAARQSARRLRSGTGRRPWQSGGNTVRVFAHRRPAQRADPQHPGNLRCDRRGAHLDADPLYTTVRLQIDRSAAKIVGRQRQLVRGLRRLPAHQYELLQSTIAEQVASSLKLGEDADLKPRD
jgi:hypothetical protein